MEREEYLPFGNLFSPDVIRWNDIHFIDHIKQLANIGLKLKLSSEIRPDWEHDLTISLARILSFSLSIRLMKSWKKIRCE